MAASPSERYGRANLRGRRIAEGLCEKCAGPRGVYGTKTLCRPCADKKATAVLKYRAVLTDAPRSENGFILRKCENCFAVFEWIGSGQRVFCDSCEPYFIDDNPNHEREQEQARKAKPERQWALNIIDDWQRQG